MAYDPAVDPVDNAAAEEVTNKINVLVNNVPLSNKTSIEEARKAYNSLTDAQKALVDPAVVQKLTDAETFLKKAEEAARISTVTPVPTPTVTPTAVPTPTAAPTPAPHVHEWSDWALTTEPTVLAEGVETRTCECGESETRPVSKLEPTMSLNFTGTLPLKQKQAFKGVIISELANGDSVKKVVSSNTKIVKASFKKGILTLKAQKKAGTAEITVTLASGLKKTFKVKVQKALVKTKKIVVLSKKVRLKKRGNFDLQTQILPISSTQKVTYQTSNKKIATVKNGVIIAGKKSGKATITVKSGSKKVKINVIVK